MKSGGDADITKFHSPQHPFHTALISLPFSCYLVSSKMAKVELDIIKVYRVAWSNAPLPSDGGVYAKL